MARYWTKVVFTACTALWLAGSAAAGQEPLSLLPGKSWTHRHSGISVPATLAGTPRERGMAFAEDDLDVGLSFTVGDAVESLTFYVFRDTNGGVPLWFAQAQWGIENRDAYGHPVIAVAPQTFVPPGQTVASGLKAIYTPKGGPYRSTGVMLFPVGEWYVKVRASSQTRPPAELGKWMDAALAEIGWPTTIANGPLAAPVTDCATPLVFEGESRDISGDMMQDAIGAALVSAAAGEAKKEPVAVQWCRDRKLEGNQAVYRANAATDAYLLAVGDNGNGIEVARSIGSLPGGAKDKALRYGIMLHMAAQDINFASQDRLPSPDRILAIVNEGRFTSTVATWGEKRDVRISGGAKQE